MRPEKFEVGQLLVFTQGNLFFPIGMLFVVTNVSVEQHWDLAEISDFVSLRPFFEENADDLPKGAEGFWTCEVFVDIVRSVGHIDNYGD